LCELTLGLDLLVEVVDDGDVHGSGARVNPVQAELVAVSLVDGLDRVSDVVQKTGEGLEAPSLAALGLPTLAVVLEGAERDEGVVGRASTQNLCTRVADVGVAHGLLGGAVVVVELTTKEVQPVLEQKDSVVHEIRRTGLNQEDLLVRKVVGETAGNNTSCSPAAHNDKVKVRRVKFCSRHCNGRLVGGKDEEKKMCRERKSEKSAAVSG